MKLFNQLKYMSVALLSVLALTGCGDDNNWSAGEEYNTKYQVVVANEAPDAGEVAAGETTTFTVTFTREVSEGAANVPITVSNTELFSAPATADFADGETSTDVTIDFKGTETLGNYTCEVSVEYGEYNNPYSEKSNACHLEILVGAWELVRKNVHIYSDELVAAYNFPELYRDLEQFSGTNLYRFKDFANGYDFKFELDNNNYVVPRGGSYYASYYWYFSDNTWNEECPLIFKEEPTHQLGWAYLYLGGYSYLNISQGYGYLYLGDGYWSSVTDADDYKEISWTYLIIYWDPAANPPVID